MGISPKNKNPQKHITEFLYKNDSSNIMTQEFCRATLDNDSPSLACSEKKKKKTIVPTEITFLPHAPCSGVDMALYNGKNR